MKPARMFLVVTCASIGLTGCGRVADLQSAPGKPLPVKPLLARTTPTANELLTPPTYARPQRVDDLVQRSEPRKPDPFDLPPPTGGAAPAVPAGSNTTAPATDTGPATPGG